MKTALKIMGGVAAGAMAGFIGYSMLNKKTRKKMAELANTMLSETKSMMK